MASTYDDSVFDFDLNFLRQTSNNSLVSSKLEKQRKSVLIVKKKTIATDSLIKKYYAKRDVLDETEKNLLASKNECKNMCIDYRNALETCSKLESDAQILKDTNKQLEERCFTSESQHGAMKSHANQLQLLVKEHETQIQALKIENKVNVKNYEKKVVLLQKEKDKLVKHICLVRDVIFGKKKITKDLKSLLQKYKLSYQADDDDVSISGEEMNNECFIDDNPMSPFCIVNSCSNNEQVQTSSENKQLSDKQDTNIISSSINKRDYNDHYYDCHNEGISVDTGRGSSLAFSDGDKSFHSPDYYINDSPLSTPIEVNKEKRQLVDIATSPLIFEDHSLNKLVQIATSPIIFEDHSLNKLVQIATSPIIFEDQSLPCQEFQKCMDIRVPTNALGVVTKSICGSITMIDKAVSPINTNIYKEISTSPIRNLCKEISTSPVKIFDNTIQNIDSGKTLQVEECLEFNNSNNICNDNDSDHEIEMILSKMRMNHQLITPIPTTPTKSGSKGPALVSNKHIDDPPGYVCQDAALVREDNKKLQASITNLAKEIMYIKSILKNQLLINNNDVQNKSILSNNELTIENDIIISDEEDNCYLSDLENLKLGVANIADDQNLSTNEVKEKQNINSHKCSKKVAQAESEPYIREEELLSNSNHISEEVNEISQKSLDRLQFEETNILSHSEDLICNDGVVDISLVKEKHGKVTKTKKLTRLEKFKKKMLPKSKIKEHTPIRRLRFKPKQLPTPKKKVTESDSSASLNDKNVYEKACKIMADLKTKQKKDVNNPKVIVEDCVKSITNLLNKSEKVNNNDFVKLKQIVTSVPVLLPKIKSRCKHDEINDANVVQSIKQKTNNKTVENSSLISENHNMNVENVTVNDSPQKTRKRPKRASVDKPDIPCKRVLRSSTLRQSRSSDTSDNNTSSDDIIDNKDDPKKSRYNLSRHQNVSKVRNHLISYTDIDTFSEDNNSNVKDQTPKGKIMLCCMIEKYGVKTVKFCAKKVSDSITNSICKKMEDDIAEIAELPPSEIKKAMDNLVLALQNWSAKQFLSGFMRYLKNPARKIELFSKVNTPPFPSMTKPEQVLLYILTELKFYWPDVDIIIEILRNIEYTLFALNRSPDFDTIESMSHFYAILCRYIRAKSRLRIFIFDAMYCMQYKAVILIKQCMDVWGHILPLAHMGTAKNPLVTCMVYLLHFYKCEDKLNRVQDIRNILKRKYFYQITDWNETKLLEMFKNSIMDLRGISAEKKMLRMALIILAKRNGPQWCQKNLIKNLLLPMIENENVPDRIKEFCTSVLGPLLKPYPNDMKVHCEIVMNQLIDMLHQNRSPGMEEAIVTSLIFVSKHNQNCVNRALLSWKPERISSEMEEILRDYVRSKPVKIWKNSLSRLK